MRKCSKQPLHPNNNDVLFDFCTRQTSFTQGIVVMIEYAFYKRLSSKVRHENNTAANNCFQN